MPTLQEIIYGPLTPQERRIYRMVPVAGICVTLGAAALGLAADAASKAIESGIHTLTTEYGCGTARVAAGQTATQAALKAGRQVTDVDNHPNLQRVITEETAAVPGSGNVDVGQTVTTCIDRNPITGFGSSGWIATVAIKTAE